MLNKLLDKITAWVMRDIDWLGFGCTEEQVEALRGLALLRSDSFAGRLLAGWE